MSTSSSSDKAFEVFVKRAITGIQKEAYGRSKEVKEVREACQAFLNNLEQQGYSQAVVHSVLHPLQLACACKSAKVNELALGCLHKLVAHAWLAGESNPLGALLEDEDPVATVVKMVVKFGESTDENLQLATVRALLTFTTAEHFTAHGDCLLAAVRTVFHLALSSEGDIKRTACNALLQMLNTIMKRVTQYQVRSSYSDYSQREELQPYFSRTVSSSQVMGSPMAANRGGPLDEPADPRDSVASERRIAQLASLAEQRDLRGLEAALEATGSQEVDDEAMVTPRASTATPLSAEGVPDEGGPPVQLSRRSGLVPGRSGSLTVSEKDVLVVLCAFCKLASRESSGSSDSTLNQGKLLALELLVKVLQNPQHNWEHVRECFARQLHQPLCLALLRNCAPSDPQVFHNDVRLLTAILCLPTLRRGLRAELGAFYPLLLLKPLEQEPPDLACLATVLSSMKQLCSDAQLVVDLFVNYDCDLQAANLYERTVAALCALSQRREVEVQGNAQAKAEAATKLASLREMALKCAFQVVTALDAWAGPIKDTSERTSDMDEASSSSVPSASAASDKGEGSPLARDGTPGSADSRFTEAERFEAAKAHKAEMTKGVALFNSNPVKGMAALQRSGVAGSTPQQVAEFIQRNHDQLDKAAIGEYFGHHEELQIRVMHAFVDLQRFQGLTIDVALRNLMDEFRLPGEAQKIDRIMEKFAERYCNDNPGLFRTAEGAYLLAFATIMLNTDAHNPMAERRLGKADFVAMNYEQVEGGDMAPVAPVAELEAIYDRIVAQEIVMKDDKLAAARGQGPAKPSKLAAAIGFAHLAQPFRSLGAWRQQSAAAINAEHKQIWELAQREVARGAAGGNIWHTASHAEHARPMLHASGSSIQQALFHAFHTAPDAPSAEAVLGYVVMLVNLAGLLGLDDLCEEVVGRLAAASGMQQPAPFDSFEEHRQLAALRALLSLALGQEAGLLGSAWPIILRTISGLDALEEELTRPLPQAAAPEPPPLASNPFSRMFSALGIGPSKPDTQQQPAAQQPVGYTSSSRADRARQAFKNLLQPLDTLLEKPSRSKEVVVEKLPVREAPGASLVIWAGSEGAAMVERVYTRSALLDGEAVLVFMRALCAVCNEELDAGHPRLFSLHKLVDCAYHNIGRIRLVWSKLWGVISSHLVGASCHTDSSLAMYAVDSLRQLVAKLLARAELAHFTHQEEALRPFVAVLRQCDDVNVRELTVTCVQQAVTAHPKGLGSGWRMVLQALHLGAVDSSPAVMTTSLEALQLVVEALYRGRGVGHEFLRECVAAIMGAVRNQAHPELCVIAVQLLQKCGRRLAERNAPEEGAAEGAAGAELSSAPLSGKLSRQASQTSPYDGEEGWALLLHSLSDVLLTEERPKVVETSMNCIDDLLLFYSRHWDKAAWQVLLHTLLPQVFCLQGEARAAAGAAAAAVADGPTANGHAADHDQQQQQQQQAVSVETMLVRLDQYYPQMCRQIGSVEPRFKWDMLQQLARISLHYVMQPDERVATAALQGYVKLVHSLAIQPDAEADAWDIVLSGLSSTVRQLLTDTADTVAALRGQWRNGMHMPAPEAQLRSRCRLLVLLQRALDAMHGDAGASMPWQIQLKLLALLMETVEGAMKANEETPGGQAQPDASSTALVMLPTELDEPPPEQQQQQQAEPAVAGHSSAGVSATQLYAQQWMEGDAGGESGDSHGSAAAAGAAALEAPAVATDDAAEQGAAAGAEDAADAGEQLGSRRSSGDGEAPAEVQYAAVHVSSPVPDAEEHSASPEPEPASDPMPFPSPATAAAAAVVVVGFSEDQQQQQEEQEQGTPTAAAGSSGSPSKPLDLQQELQQLEQVAVLQGLTSSSSSSGSIVPGVPASNMMPPLAASNSSSRESSCPALMRLEAEGGLLLLGALQRSLSQLEQQQQEQLREQEQEQQQEEDVSGVQQQLEKQMWYVMVMIISAAAHVDSSGRHSSGGSSEAPAQLRCSWDDALRAPLVVEALKLLLRRSSTQQLPRLRQDVAAVFPQLAALLCSSQPMVRQVLHDVFKAVQLDKLAAAGVAV